MKLGIMQPYLFPYIGYFQLMNVVDEFILYDNIKYTKKGWINRNRIQVNGKEEYISFPLKKDSDYLDIKDRSLAQGWPTERIKLLNKITAAYKKAPYFEEVFPVLSSAIMFDHNNLFTFIFNSLQLLKEYLSLRPLLIPSSSVLIDHGLKAENKVIALCKARNADIYINPSGGRELYQKDHFKKEGITLRFIQTKDFSYLQPGKQFIPHLSVIDVMMYNPKEKITDLLDHFYTLE